MTISGGALAQQLIAFSGETAMSCCASERLSVMFDGARVRCGCGCTRADNSEELFVEIYNL